MIIFLVVFLATEALFSGSCNPEQSDKRVHTKSGPEQPAVRCPVCGLDFPLRESAATAIFNGKTYYFFLADHQKTFKLNPQMFIDALPTRKNIKASKAPKREDTQ